MTTRAAPEMTRVERWMPLVAGVLIATPTLLARYLPMSDLPMHEALVGLLRHFGDPKYMPEGLYVRNFGHPNQLFHLTSWMLSYVVSTSAAVRIVVAASQIGIFLGGAHFADYVGRSRWGVLLLTPLALGFLFYWGLVANLIGIAALLFLLPALDRSSKEGSLRSALRACGMLVVLFFAHETIFLTALAILSLFASLQPLSPRASAFRVLPIAFGIATALAQQIYQKQFASHAPLIKMSYLPFWRKVELLPNALFGSYDTIERAILFFLAVFAAALLAKPLVDEIRKDIRERRRADEEEPRSRLVRARAFLFRQRFALVGVAFAVGYFIIPFNWNGATMLHERALAPAWAILCVLAAPISQPRPVARLAVAVVPIGVLALAWPQFVDADRTYRDLDKIIEHIPYGASVAQASLDVAPQRTRAYSAGTGAARIAADRGGRVALSLTASPIAPIQIRREYRWFEQDFRMLTFGSRTMIPAHDLKRQQWVVGQSRDPHAKSLYVRVLAPEAEFVAEYGEWLLFRSTFPAQPLTIPEELPPDDAETVLVRAQRLVRAQQEKTNARAPALEAKPAAAPPTMDFAP